MNHQQQINFTRIADAIQYITLHFKDQPSLDEVAKHVHMSPFHLQRLFTEWAGVSPKKFLQFLSLDYAKSILKNKNYSLFDAAFDAGLSGTGRLHDLFVKIEGMTPGEYKNGGLSLQIRYSFANTNFGDVLVAATQKGICHLSFTDDKEKALTRLRQQFPFATYIHEPDKMQQEALQIFTINRNRIEQIKLHLKATPFQLKVWEALLKIPMGKLGTYQDVSHAINNPKACRAVGTAIGHNPVAYIIPCHRVIKTAGIFGQYHWGATRKSALIGWEASHVNVAG